MPALTLATIRKPYRYRGYLTVVPEAVVLEGTLSATPSYPALTLAYTLTSGSEANVLADMEVELYTSANVFKGRLRVAQGGTITSTSLPVNEFSKGRLNLVSGDKFKVLRSWRIRDRLVAANATFDKDSRIAYSTQNEDIAPIACAGGAWAGFVDAGQSYATLSLSAAESYALDSDSGGDLNFLWDVGDGTITVGTDTDESITATFPTGSRWVHLQVEDDDNGATSDYYFPVVVHNTTSARPHEVIVNSQEGERAAGWRMTFQLPAGADIEDLPDGALVIYHEDEYYGGVQGSYGHPVSNRSRVKFTGYVTADSITVDAFTNEVSFEAVGALGILENLPGFSQILEEATSPANWQQYQGLTVFQAIIYLLRTGTTLLNVCDVLLHGDDAVYPALYIQKAVPLQQVKELADGMSWELLCDRTGRVMFSRKLTRMDSTDRNAAATTATLTADDRIRMTARREHRSSLNTLIARGFSAGSNPAPLMSKAPGAAPDEGAGETIVERLIEASQDSLNALSGWAYAEQTKRYNGLPAPTIDMELPGGYDGLDFYPEWLALTQSGSANKRGIALNAARGVLERISIQHDPARGAKAINASWQHETDGAAGITVYPDNEALNGLPPYEIPYITPPVLPRPPNAHYRLPIQAWLLGRTNAPVYYATSMDLETGVITFQQNSYSGMTGDGCWGTSDPFKYARKFALTDDGLFRTEDIITAAGTFVSVANNATMLGDASRIGNYIFPSINRAGWYMVISGVSGYAVTADYGATWYQGALDGGSPSWNTTVSYRGDRTFSHAAISPRSGGAYGGVILATRVTAGATEIWKNTGWGLSGSTWTKLGEIYTGTFPAGGTLDIPLDRDDGSPNYPDANMQVYAICCANNGAKSYLYRSADGGATWTPLQRLDAYGVAGDEAPNISYRAINNNARYVYAVNFRANTGPANTYWQLAKASLTAAVTNASYPPTGWGGHRLNLNGWPYNDTALIYFASDDDGTLGRGVVAYSLDGGATITDCTPAGLSGDSYSVRYAEFDLGAVEP